MNTDREARGWNLESVRPVLAFATALILLAIACNLPSGGSGSPTLPPPVVVTQQPPVATGAPASPTAAPPTLVAAEPMTITGSLAFPSEGIPPMFVFAQNADTGETFTVTKGSNQASYSLNVTPGTYHVFAYVVTVQALTPQPPLPA